MSAGITTQPEGESPPEMIDARIKDLGDWRGETLSRLRSLIKEADPEVVEEWKWSGVPVWYHDGMVCTGEPYESIVKMTFAKGASLKDPSSPFNSSLDGKVRRAIDIHDGESIEEEALKILARDALALNEVPARRWPRARAAAQCRRVGLPEEGELASLVPHPEAQYTSIHGTADHSS